MKNVAKIHGTLKCHGFFMLCKNIFRLKLTCYQGVLKLTKDTNQFILTH